MFCIATAIAAILLGHQLINSFENKFLKSYFYYLIAFYAFAFYGIWSQLVVQYVLIDIQIEQKQLLAVVNFLPALGIPFLLVSWIMLLKVSLIINGSSLIKKEILMHLISILLITLSIVSFYFLAMNTGWWKSELLLYIEYGFLMIAELVYLILFIGIIAKGRSQSNGVNSKIYLFANLFLVGFSVRVIVLITAALNSILLAPAVLLYFLSGIIPILFLRYFADSILQPIQATNGSKKDLDSLFERYQISKREREIISLICLGKSNQQIANELFISLQTVKDHNHRIYTKVGIKSRLQLVAIINE